MKRAPQPLPEDLIEEPTFTDLGPEARQAAQYEWRRVTGELEVLTIFRPPMKRAALENHCRCWAEYMAGENPAAERMFAALNEFLRMAKKLEAAIPA